jgi:threonine dehydratase
MKEEFTLSDIREAHDRIRPYIHRTPILTSESINKMTGATIFFKCENFQKVGAFKARGGMNAVFSLTEEERAKGVTTHSSGNHAQAIALAASLAGCPAYIVMPENAPQVKKAAVREYGGEIIECPATQKDRELGVEKLIKEKEAAFIHPYNDRRIICGQATAAKELLEDVTDTLDYILAPVGGGGLLSGTALSTYFLSPNTQVIGCEPTGADDAYRSFYGGVRVPMDHPDTVADGLRTSLGELTFDIIRTYVKDIMLVEDEVTLKAMRTIWERMKIIIEPSCAVPLGVVFKNKEKFVGKKIGIILTGGNIDLDAIPFNS